jgi:hypothetical protein
MAEVDLATSLESGGHALLKQLVGRWEGRARLWLEPGVLHCEDTVRGEMSSIHGGRWVRHTYETPIDGVDESGTALLGCSLDRGTWQVAWVDSWHTGTDVMVSEGPCLDGDTKIVVATTYTGEPGGPEWGWRSEFEPHEEGLYVRHYNSTPAGEEALAVEFAYRGVRPYKGA